VIGHARDAKHPLGDRERIVHHDVYVRRRGDGRIIDEPPDVWARIGPRGRTTVGRNPA
jgi:hypothetical protein